MTTHIGMRRLTRSPSVTVFAVCHELVGCDTPASQQCSTPVIALAPAAPQCISGRTSYLRVRLAFHPYPQLLRAFCNRHRCGPSRPVTGAAAWPWVAHTVSGQLHATSRACHTRVRSACGCHCLKRRRTATRRVILQKARDHPAHAGLSLPGRDGFQALFHSPRRGTFHRSLTVLCTIGHQE